MPLQVLTTRVIDLISYFQLYPCSKRNKVSSFGDCGPSSGHGRRDTTVVLQATERKCRICLQVDEDLKTIRPADLH